MIEGIIIGVLCFIVIVLLVILIKRQISEKKLLWDLKQYNDGDTRKLFAKGNSVQSEIIYELNKLVQNYTLNLNDYRKKEENNNELLTSLSHDIRTPITSLIGYLDALNTDILNEAEKIEYVRICIMKAADLKNYVNTLFDWFKINSSEMKLNFERIDLNELTRNILIERLPEVHTHDIALNTQISDVPFFIKLDSLAYKRIVDNLVSNAIAHSECDTIFIYTQSSEHKVTVSVGDNGKGISQEKLPLIFKRLYKCDNARSKNGSGLGLAIVKELVRLLGAEITVKSEENNGTEFTVSFNQEK